jgi:hypothetical protein
MSQVAETYDVKPGDTLSGIAAHFGITLQKLLEANQQIQNPDLVVVGQKINIPGTAPAAPVTPATPVVAAPGQPVIYDGIHPAPGTVSTSRANYVHPPLTNSPGQRDAAVYSQLINQFAVGNNPRYLPGGGNTYCNIFVWDVSRAMGAEVPHWIDAAGNIAAPAAPNANEININGGVNWMKSHGVPQQGWRSATAQEAQDAANQGLLAVVMWKNPTGGHGHTAVVRPGSINAGGPAIGQAGAHNFNMGHVVNGFGHLSPEYFCHD